ncbi:MAG: response regulator [Gammaproteobacteria bacterium]|nr:response regulator [Gammaproteobacteria bacterium]
MSDKTALVIDDSKSARYALRKFLEGLGYHVDTADGAHDAYAYLRRKQPSIVFLDHVMPDIDGMDALRTLKQDRRTASIPVVICSSDESEIFVARARAQGAAAVLSKPPNPVYLAPLLERLCVPETADSSSPSPARAAVASAAHTTSRYKAPRAVANVAAAPTPAAELLPALQQLIVELERRNDELCGRIEALECKIEQRLCESALHALAGNIAERLTLTLTERLNAQITGLRTDLETILRAQSRRLQQLAATVEESVSEQAQRVARSAVDSRLAELFERLHTAFDGAPGSD